MAKSEEDARAEHAQKVAKANRDTELARRKAFKDAQRATQASEHRPLVRAA